ncbi:hypothetical protein BP6252_11814 [Coleophoma cylindrospora]|uniref:Uncharacterized protein n=1 Tax=Coleophoma cylindrospora TaxID=1849047 RepID=A0A3D8QKZ6_9HELO|nr:hypothetical protein BP6252_11814 [Coleophoma cylindrospora]
MFGNRRRRAASNPPLNASTANPSATSAATQAFLKSQASNASLSSAAAAAALRSRPTTPTSVADVQTKRMMRRMGSTSSMGSSRSGGSGRGPPGASLERRGSVGSMTERTFRDPSPSRSSPVPSAIDAPPVPAIPKNLGQNRASSLEAPHHRVASPIPHTSNGRGSSLQPAGHHHPRTAGQRNSISSVADLASPESRGSVNFSYPTGARPQSPVTNSQLTDESSFRPPRITAANNKNLIYDPNTRSFLPAAEIYAIEQKLRDAANAPVKKQKRIAPKQNTGTHLADGTVGGRPKGTAVDAMEAARKTQESKPAQQPKPVSVPAATQGPVVTLPAPKNVIPQSSEAEIKSVTAPPVSSIAPKKKKRVTMTESGSDTGSNVGSDYDSDSTRPKTFNPRTSPLSSSGLAKKPSVVREDREREEEEDDTPKRLSFQGPYPPILPKNQDQRTISPSPLPRSRSGRGRGQALAPTASMADKPSVEAVSQPTTTPISQEPATPVPATNGMNGLNGDAKPARMSSVSPPRTAHFAATPENLAVLHQPPNRSVSPRKSAMKHSPSRDDSPGAVGGSEASENSMLDEPPKPKKKSVRVSFDDESNVVVGHAAPSITTDSPVIQSPQLGKSRWFSISGRGKKKDILAMEDDDEVMKPRPALPSFGSIRERKNRDVVDVEERPLVKPADNVVESTKPTPPTSPIFTSPTGEPIEYPLGQSNDHAMGALISQDSTARNAANISKSREPLPPEVTSVEGSGYQSDSSSTHSMDEIAEPEAEETYTKAGEITQPEVSESPETPAETESLPTPHPNGHVPSIAVLPATPKAEDEPKQQWLAMPGAWGEVSDAGSQPPSPMIVAEHVPTEPTPAVVGIAEPVPEVVQQVGAPSVGEIAATQYQNGPILEETEDSESGDIYTDAAEDLSDFDGDGFLSLDAVVESPIPKAPATAVATSSPPESPINRLAKEKAYERMNRDSAPDIGDGWDKAQQYWSGLTADKKRQLEQEAREEIAAEASNDEEKSAPKPRKTKKKVQVQAPDSQKNQPAVNSERTYMIMPGTRMSPDIPKVAPAQTKPIRTSMRSEPANGNSEPHMRKSMRAAAPTTGGMKSSMREAPVQQKGSLQKKYRPTSLPAADISTNSAAINKHVRNMSAGATTAQPPPTLRRTSSQDSDSSFKRTRAKPDSKFRGSMRNSIDEKSPPRSSRFSLRSLSPSGSVARRPFNSQNTSNGPPVSLRSSAREQRNSYDSGAPSLRGPRARSPSGNSLLSFGRSSKAAPATKPAPRRSRFADSDSEEDTARPAFRSRFADSDSDDAELPKTRVKGGFGRGTMRSSAPAPKSAPVRPIPARKGVDDGDSSDLPDSDDEKSPRFAQPTPAKTPQVTNGDATIGSALGSGVIRRSGSGRGTISVPIAGSVSGRPNHSRRGSFMSILKRKKPDPNAKIRKSDAESAARRDTPLERSKSDLAALYASPSDSPTPASRPMSPKLQKRNPVSRENSQQAWPLPDPPSLGDPEKDRPFTSDGMANGDGASPVMSRRFTATGLSGVDTGLDSFETPRKKKKFGALRKMFRLDD